MLRTCYLIVCPPRFVSIHFRWQRRLWAAEAHSRQQLVKRLGECPYSCGQAMAEKVKSCLQCWDWVIMDPRGSKAPPGPIVQQSCLQCTTPICAFVVPGQRMQRFAHGCHGSAWCRPLQDDELRGLAPSPHFRAPRQQQTGPGFLIEASITFYIFLECLKRAACDLFA